MVNRLGCALSSVFQRFMPDPFLFALILTFVAMLLALGFTEQPVFEAAELPDGTIEHQEVLDEDGEPVTRATTIMDVLNAWRGVDPRTGRVAWDNGFWGLLAFAMQMSLILVTGYALATSRPVRFVLNWFAAIPKTSASGAATVALVAMLAGLINWGFGLVVGAVLAKKMAALARTSGIKMHYPLLGAAGYMGLLVWHGGLSGSAPLEIAGAVHGDAAIPVSETLFGAMNLLTNALLLVAVPVLFYLMAPKREGEIVEIRPDQMLPHEADRHFPPADEGEPKPADLERDPADAQSKGAAPEGEAPPSGRAPDEASPQDKLTVGDKLNRSPLTTVLICLIAFAVIVNDLLEGRFNLDLFTVPFLFLFFGLLAHWRPIHYVRAVGQGTSGAAGILLQFPFYAGIFGILVGTGLNDVIVEWISAAATQETLPVLSFLSAAVVNMFIPSGGGQWAVQGDIALGSAARLGIDPALAVMFVAYGDQITNMLQPFWALALLGITGLRARDIMGYTAAIMLLVLPIFLVLITAFALASAVAPPAP